MIQIISMSKYRQMKELMFMFCLKLCGQILSLSTCRKSIFEVNLLKLLIGTIINILTLLFYHETTNGFHRKITQRYIARTISID